MMMRRRRPLMRAAMVGGVAYHAGKKVQEGREEDAYRDAEIASSRRSRRQRPLQRPRRRLPAGSRTTRSTSSSSSAS